MEYGFLILFLKDYITVTIKIYIIIRYASIFAYIVQFKIFLKFSCLFDYLS